MTKKQLNEFLKDKDYLVHCAIDETNPEDLDMFINAFNYCVEHINKSKYQSMKFAQKAIKATKKPNILLSFTEPYFKSEAEELLRQYVGYEDFLSKIGVQIPEPVQLKYLEKLEKFI